MLLVFCCWSLLFVLLLECLYVVCHLLAESLILHAGQCSRHDSGWKIKWGASNSSRRALEFISLMHCFDPLQRFLEAKSKLPAERMSKRAVAGVGEAAVRW